jgi:hypothetical protein
VLQRLLPTVSLQCNTAKSHFVYFHEEAAPLMRSIRQTLAAHDIQLHEHWIEVMGAVIGRDDDAIRAGVVATFGADSGRDAFFRRLQFEGLSVQSAMLLLRHCAVPQLNHLLRCVPPPCIAEHAEAFDQQVLQAAMDKLEPGQAERSDERAVRLVQSRLRHGGLGLTPAQSTSAAAYLGSLAAVHSAPVFAPYSKADTPLPSSTMLHGWIKDSMRRLTTACPDAAPQLPSSASAFFAHYANASPSISSSLLVFHTGASIGHCADNRHDVEHRIALPQYME